MKRIIAGLIATIATSMSLSASAEVFVPYGQQWTSLPNCGGYTRLVCDDVANAKYNNRCRIEFNNSYSCPMINLYTNSSYYPKYGTSTQSMQGSFYVDYSKVFWNTFYVYMYNADKSSYEQITYQFAY